LSCMVWIKGAQIFMAANKLIQNLLQDNPVNST